MSDAPHPDRPLVPGPRFLERVIDGAFDRVGPLEPRRPSRYEPQTIGIIDPFADRGDAWDGEPESSRRAAVAEGGQAPARPPVPRLDATQRSVRLEVAPDRDERSAPRSVTIPAERPAPPPHPVFTVLDAPRPEGVRRDDDRRPLELEEAIAGVLSRPTPASLEAPHAPEAASVDSRSRHVQPAAEPQPTRGEPMTPGRDRSNRSAVEPVRVAPAARHDWLQARAASTPAPEPVVNVTIGRIEVRVAPAAQAQTRQRPDGHQPMGLDQYLRQRGGRR